MVVRRMTPLECISIHAPRVGRDAEGPAFFSKKIPISIHAPRVGRDHDPQRAKGHPQDFNPRAPCGARRRGPGPAVEREISIHAPRVGRDNRIPTRRVHRPISIHAPRVGRDRGWRSHGRTRNYFNPRAPCGARPGVVLGRPWSEKFQSTRPVWGATSQASTLYRTDVFQSTRPVWGATAFLSMVYTSTPISIHAPRVGRDSKFDDFTPSNLHKRYKRVLARPKNTREKGKIKQKLAYIHAFSAFLGCEGSGTFCALVLRTQYR